MEAAETFHSVVSIEKQNGQSFLESSNGEGVENWFGLLRNLSPAQTQQGRILYDVNLTSYRLRLTNAGEPGAERYAWVDIPLRLESESGPEGPTPGNSLK